MKAQSSNRIAAQKSNVGARCGFRQGSSSDRAGEYGITFLMLYKNDRRGVILIIVLGLLGLLAAIGITFAVLARYEGRAALNFKRSFTTNANTALDIPARQLAQFGISQLIYDTRRTNSALRGHSLLRDMYGSPIANDGSPGADPEAKDENVDPKTYIGAFNGTGIFSPLTCRRRLPSRTPI
ncbi:MAG: hypothetical protein U1D30_26115 [Planctomycetota bacterium]